MDEQPWIKDHERLIRKTNVWLVLLLGLSFAMAFLPFTGIFKPEGEAFGAWWQRAGAPVTIFAFLAQIKAQYLAALLTPGSFTSQGMERLRRQYRRIKEIGTLAASMLTVLGTIIWGYGDLLIRSLQHLYEG